MLIAIEDMAAPPPLQGPRPTAYQHLPFESSNWQQPIAAHSVGLYPLFSQTSSPFSAAYIWRRSAVEGTAGAAVLSVRK